MSHRLPSAFQSAVRAYARGRLNRRAVSNASGYVALDGVASRVDLGPLPLQQSGLTTCTWGLWFFLNGELTYYNLVGRSEESGTPPGPLVIRILSSGTEVSVFSPVGPTESAPRNRLGAQGLPDLRGAWHHLLGVVEDGVATGLYLDGVPLSPSVVDNTAAVSWQNPAYLGALFLNASSGIAYAYADICEYFCVPGALSLAQIADVYGRGKAGNVLDVLSPYAGSGHYLHVDSRARSGSIPNALGGAPFAPVSFDATSIQFFDDVPEEPEPEPGSWRGTKKYSFGGYLYMNAGPLHDITPDRAFTITAWVYPTASGTRGIVSNRGDGDYQGFEFRMTSSLLTGLIADNTLQKHKKATSALALNQWSHVALTVGPTTDAADVKLYVNGVLVAMTTVYNNIGATIGTPGMFLIAELYNASGFPFLGAIRDVGLWGNVEMTAEQVASVYNGGTFHDLSTGFSPAPTAFWEIGAAEDTFDNGGTVHDLTGNGWDLTCQNTNPANLTDI
jgi:hypothetical protein